MKRKIINFTIGLALTSLLMLPGCKKDFLDVVDPTVLPTSSYPANPADLELILNDLYGRLKDGTYSAIIRSIVLIEHSNDHGYNGAEFNEFALNKLNPDLARLTNFWNNQFFHVAKCNDFLVQLARIRTTPNLTAVQLTRLNQMEGEARYMRAFLYFHLVNQFGETPIITEADKAKMGVPLWTELTTTISGTNKERATQGQIYDFLIADLEAAAPLLKGYVPSQKPRVTEWAVKTLLAKSYVFTLQYLKAQPILKDIIDNSGKSLVSYTIYRNSFTGSNEFNAESIWEVNYTNDPKVQSGTQSTGNRYTNYVSITYDKAGVETINGYSNFYVHDRNIPRFGYDDTTTVYQNTAANKAKSLLIRANKTADPRLWVNVMQPFVDTVKLVASDPWRTIVKGRMEGYNSRNFKGWNNRKYAQIDAVFSVNNGINYVVFRLPEVYLLYAECLIKAGDNVNALEYINKVHRRAYDVPVNTASIYDYATLTDRTKTVEATDHLANDPLKYERWAEFCNECNWWYEVRRWDLGQKEATYYKRVMGGTLEWFPGNYSWQIPTAEMNANAKMIQNP
jgi:hypothetical protein